MVYIISLFVLLLLFLPINIELLIKNGDIKLIIYRLIIINLSKKVNNKEMKKVKTKKISIDYKDLLVQSKTLINIFLKFLKTTYIKLDLRLLIATSDAFNTALFFGAINTVIYGIIGYLSSFNNFKHDINITTDFNNTKSNIYLRVSIVFNLFFSLIFLVRLYITIKKSLKGGVENVRTSNRSFNENYNG